MWGFVNGDIQTILIFWTEPPQMFRFMAVKKIS